LGKDLVFVGTPSCSALLCTVRIPVPAQSSLLRLRNDRCGSSATGLARYYQKAGIEATVCCFTGDGDASDIGFQVMSGAAERNEKLMYVCYDNEGYMNTGNQRSSRTPYHAATSTTPVGPGLKGKPTASKDLPLIMAMHPLTYVATATLSNMEDYARKLLKAKEASKRGFAYVHVFAPCIIGFKIPTDAGIQVCRAAVRTNYFRFGRWKRANLPLIPV